MLMFEINPIYRDEPIPNSSSKIIQWFGFDNFEPERAVTSHFVSTKTLFFIRLPLTLYCFIVFWVDVIYTSQAGEFRHFLAYFTDLTFIGLLAYLITTTFHHASYIWTRQSIKRPSSFFNQPSILNYLYVYLYHTVIVFNIQTPVVFWALLAKEKLFDANLSAIDFWISITLHTVTLGIILIEIFLNRMNISINMVVFVFGTVLFYLFLVLIIYSVEKWWVYSFLDWSAGPKACIWYIIIAVFIVVCFFFQVVLHKLRDFMAKRLMKKYRLNLFNDSTAEEKGVPTGSSIHQTSSFELLASRMGPTSSIAFSDSIPTSN